LEITGNICPDLFKVFFTNLTFEGESMWSRVKGMDMDINPVVWTTITNYYEL